MQDFVLACQLTSAELRERRNGLIAEVRGVARRKEWTGDALCLYFGSEASDLEKVLELVRLERQCCPFLTFRVETTPEQTLLEISGPNGTGAFLREVGFG